MTSACKWLLGLVLAALAIGPGGTTRAVVPAAGTAPVPTDRVDLGGRVFSRYEWRASTFGHSAQSEVSLGVDGAGRVVAVWSSRRQQGGRYGVYGQRFDAAGAPLGGETRLNLAAARHERAPAVALDRRGAAWVVWESHGRDGDAGSIVARRFDRKLRGGPEVPLNVTRRGHQANPAVASAADGTACAVWTLAPHGVAPRGRARLLGADGAPCGGEIGFGASGGVRTPAVAAGAAGAFLIVHAVTDERGRPAGIRALLLPPDGGGPGEPVDVAGRPGAIEPAVSAVGDGYVVCWLEAAGGDYQIRARLLDAAGCPAGGPFPVAAPDGPGGSRSAAAVAGAADGSFAVAFNADDGDGPGVFVRRFAADGSAAGPAARLTGRRRGPQAMRAATGAARLVFSGDGSLLCGWSGDGGFGDGSSANVTMLSSRSLAAAPRGVAPAMAPASRPQETARPHQPPVFDAQRADRGTREVVTGLSGIGFTGIFSTGWVPPDPHLAVGPDDLVLVTNGAIAFFSKTGDLEFQDQLEGPGGFWGELGATSFVFDPEVLYDPLSGRFFALAAEAFVPGDRSFVFLAVSDDSDPQGPWHKYRFETTAAAGDVFDSPNLAVDGQAVYITGDAVGGFLQQYAVIVFEKAALLAGDPPAVIHLFTIPSLTLSAGIPPVSFDDPPALYLIEHQEGDASDGVRLMGLVNPLEAPIVFSTVLAVPTYGPPENPPQMGTSVRPDTFDARFWSAHFRDGSLWAAHHVNADRVLVRWYEIAMNGWPVSGAQPQVVQSGTIDPGPGVRTFFGAITADGHGNAALVFSRSAPDEFISMATAFRFATDPPGTFQPGVIRRDSDGPYTEIGRWGDYGAVRVDPDDGITMWAQHEFAASGSWRTWVTGFTPAFDPADLNFDGRVGVEDLLLLLGAWGPCPDPPEPCADLDGDGAVGVVDFLTLLASWGV